jgi:hypothetical protein
MVELFHHFKYEIKEGFESFCHMIGGIPMAISKRDM